MSILAVQERLQILDIAGCLVVADALNCQKETMRVIAEGEADYLLSVKDSHPTLKEAMAEYIQDDALRKAMDTSHVTEKNSGRIERRTTYSESDIGWLYGREEWKTPACIGAVRTP